ncbi:hypothetical protein BV917_09075 [Leptospira santarosai serovar Guaricura]|nr:hypothetical protein BV917_09075 [Leptospira santarosai serovar Guaricura]
MLFGDFVFDISLLQTILFALFAIMTLFQGRLNNFSTRNTSQNLKTRALTKSECSPWPRSKMSPMCRVGTYKRGELPKRRNLWELLQFQ